MLAKRIIPCLDVKDGTTVKGVQFVNFRDAGDPVELGKQYSQMGADELVYLDITASHEGRRTFTDLVRRIAAEVSIPFTVGGGIHELSDVERLLAAGADKVSVNSSALRRPELITEIAERFGRQECVCAIDARLEDDGQWRCYLNGGRIPTQRYDGSKQGFANDALARLSDELSIPIIASGGAGTKEHFLDVFQIGHADAALAASVFHFGEIPMRELKLYLADQGINVRL